MDFKDRLKECRNEHHLSQQQTADKLGIAKRTYESYERGERDVSTLTLLKICTLFSVSSDYLLGKSDTKQFAQSEKKENVPLSVKENEHIKKYRTLDKYGKKAVDELLQTEFERCSEEVAHAKRAKTITINRSFLATSAGTGEYLSEGNYEPREYPDTPEARQADVVIPVSGDSMEPMFYDGDELYVRQQPSVNIGEIGIFFKNGCGYVKEAGEDRLISLNPVYDDIRAEDEESIVCFGKVLGKVEN